VRQQLTDAEAARNAAEAQGAALAEQLTAASQASGQATDEVRQERDAALGRAAALATEQTERQRALDELGGLRASLQQELEAAQRTIHATRPGGRWRTRSGAWSSSSPSYARRKPRAPTRRPPLRRRWRRTGRASSKRSSGSGARTFRSRRSGTMRSAGSAS
jgi:hypothetical protein